MKRISPRLAALRAGLLSLLVLAAVAPRADAQSPTGSPPELMTYQGFLTDNSGTPLANDRPRNYDVKFRLYDASSGGNRVWSEQQTVTVDKGYFSILLGQGGTIAGEANATSFSGVFSGGTASDRFLSLSVVGQGPGGADLLIEPRLRLLPGPYAFLAKNANALANSSGAQVVTLSGNSISVGNSGSSLTVNGTITANSFSGNGANLTGLDGSKITAGTLSTDRVPNLDAAKITSGTLNDARLSGDVAKLSGSQTFSGAKTINGGMNLNSTLSVGTGGMIGMNGNAIRLRDASDSNHVLGYSTVVSGSFGFAAVDGPVLYGYSGGVLGSRDRSANDPSLMWGWSGTQIWGRPANNPTGATAWRDAQQLQVRPRDYWYMGNRLALGMAHVNNVEYSGIIQAYTGSNPDSNEATTLRLNPLGGTVYAVITSPSDKNIKTGFEAVDGRTVLQKLSELPVSTWTYTNATSVRHMGPTAQDFLQTFGLGNDSKGITTVDANGVAFAAIQGLNSIVKEKDEEIQSLKRELQELRALVEGLARRNTTDRP